MTRSEALAIIYRDAYEDAASFGEHPDICAFSAQQCRAFYATASKACLASAIEDHTGTRYVITEDR